ncbi:hypothetical protein [Chitinilyticum piscinae]|uniref:Uncharacterized protein n=1 Tax=Chitinilyticum piscinae TaxID=2866724 RepID=A0A8J7KAI3_9NEIS|nr:hypothetical protein [Chitinilyticum piscinae]MBE9609154.1 hypothetical protein [Chitinilyticum piscinae]
MPRHDDERRFDLGAIDEQKKRLEDAKAAARDKDANRSSGKLAALSNLPFLIVLIAVLAWYLTK